MVWIISRHYSDDARMGSLMERIANEIGDKVGLLQAESSCDA
jgi:dynein heavy chain